ncbi:MAG: hypothetical protein U0136_17435 [Bdellovibrionota bacterium]
MSAAAIRISFGDVRKKRIVTPNHFVSHMLEHISWRMGLSVEVDWKDDDWRALGRAFGVQVAQFHPQANDSAALGMIDDGSAVVAVRRGTPKVEFQTVAGIDRDWFVGLRCEQVESGRPLLDLFEGLSEGLNATLSVEVWTVEDAHHTWEGIYRALGIALGRIYCPLEPFTAARAELKSCITVDTRVGTGALEVTECGPQVAAVRRHTAETKISARVDFSSGDAVALRLNVDESIEPCVHDLERLLAMFSFGLGAKIDIDFEATTLSSSHVVMEDIGLVVGRALLEVLKLRMELLGVNAAGSTVRTLADLSKNVRVGVSVEGRKFWRLVPRDGNAVRFKQAFLLGQNVGKGLRSEDLDDFIDGLAGGMSASLMIHVSDYSNPDAGWREIFRSLGDAFSEAFDVNPFRRGVPPGVKATLV